MPEKSDSLHARPLLPSAGAKRIPWSEGFLLIVLALAVLVMSQLSPVFFTVRNLAEIFRFSAEIGLISLGMTLVIITAGIDLSVGSTLGLCAVLLGLGFSLGLNIWLALALAVLAGGLLGYLNGAIITRVGIPPLIVTLATLAIYRGLALGISQARSFGGYPEAFLALGRGYTGPVPVQAIVLMVMVLLFWFLLAKTTLGRFIYAIGNNSTAARFSGVAVDRVLVIVYTLSGLLAGLAGVIFVARISSAKADAGIGYELDAITAVVLGGTSIAGGVGGIGPTVLGLFLVAVVRNGLTLAFIPTEVQNIVVGAILLLAVLFNQLIRLRTARA
jgi:rhamnose transport system permease protein